MHITSPTNPRIKALVRLQQKAAERRQTGRFCVETERALSRALTAGYALDVLYMAKGAAPLEAALQAQVEASGASVVTLSSAAVDKAAYRENPRGLIGVMQAQAASVEQGIEGLQSGCVLVCSGLEKPGNLGAILRSADGAGVGAVFVDRPGFDLYNPNIIRASTGAVFSLPVVCAEADEISAALSDAGARLVGLTPEAAVDYAEADLSAPLALVVGAEAEGLAASWRMALNEAVSLPMRGLCDSLNVSVAAAVIMYEVARRQGR